MTFLSWLEQQTERDDPTGDLARDAADDSRTPKGDAKFFTWRNHLWATGACDEALIVLGYAYREYRKDRDGGNGS